MTVRLEIPYETLVKLVEQLPDEQQRDLLRHLQQATQRQKLTSDEWVALLRSAQNDRPVREEPSIRREDWYDDDGR